MLINFLQHDESTQWKVINDGVMGGKSQGKILSVNERGIFSGHISLDNNGGFSSIVRSVESVKANLSNAIIDIESPVGVKSNNYLYQLRVSVDINGYKLAYKHDFKLPNGQRKKIHLSLDDFQASFRGRLINNAPPLVSEKIIEVGVLVKSDVAGEFNLHIHAIELT